MTRIHARMKTKKWSFLAVVNIYICVLCEDKICIVNMKKRKKKEERFTVFYFAELCIIGGFT